MALSCFLNFHILSLQVVKHKTLLPGRSINMTIILLENGKMYNSFLNCNENSVHKSFLRFQVSHFADSLYKK